MKQIKVLHVVLGLDVGGLEKFVLDLIANYRNEVNSYVACLNTLGSLSALVEREKIFHIDEKTLVNKVQRLKRLIVSLDIDLIHTHNPSPHLYGVLSSIFTTVPIIHTKHGRNYPESLRKVILNYILSRLSFRVVPVSTDAFIVCQQIEKVPSAKLKTIFNGIDEKRFTRSGPTTTIAVPGRICLGIVARLSSEKNHQLLLNSFQVLLAAGNDLGLLIVGDGNLRGSLELKAVSLGISDRVVFAGMLDNIPNILRKMDVFILPSLTEGMSLTLLEAMACELPVVATDVGGNSQVVIHGETGLVVPTNDVKALVDALQRLIDSPSLRTEMGKKGRLRVVEHFTIRNTAERYVQLYRDALDGP